MSARRTTRPRFDSADSKERNEIGASGQNRLATPGRIPLAAMQYLLLVYTDAELLDKLPAPDFNTKMRDCLLDLTRGRFRNERWTSG